MLAFLAFHELGGRLVSCPCLYHPEMRFAMAALGAFCINQRQVVIVFLDNIKLSAIIFLFHLTEDNLFVPGLFVPAGWAGHD